MSKTQQGKKVERDFQEHCHKKGPEAQGSVLVRGLQVTRVGGVHDSGRPGPRGRNYQVKESRLYAEAVGAVGGFKLGGQQRVRLTF